MLNFFKTVDSHFHHFCLKYADKWIRLAFGVIYVWYGALKVFDKSPAESFVNHSTLFLAIDDFSFFLGIFEVFIGAMFLIPRCLKLALILFFLKVPGTFLPLVVVPADCFVSFPFELTLAGQYILKNLILIGAALHLYSKTKSSD